MAPELQWSFVEAAMKSGRYCRRRGKSSTATLATGAAMKWTLLPAALQWSRCCCGRRSKSRMATLATSEAMKRALLPTARQVEDGGAAMKRRWSHRGRGCCMSRDAILWRPRVSMMLCLSGSQHRCCCDVFGAGAVGTLSTCCSHVGHAQSESRLLLCAGSGGCEATVNWCYHVREF